MLTTIVNPLTISALSISVCALVLDALLFYRQFHVAPWDLEASETDLEGSKQEHEEPAQVHETDSLAQSPTVHENTPLISAHTSSYGTVPTEKTHDDFPLPEDSGSTEWPPPHAPRWFFGLKRSQYFLSPAERPAIFSRWYHIFKLLWPTLIVNEFLTPRPNPDSNQREPHPQAVTSTLLFVFTALVKIVYGLVLHSKLTIKDHQPGLMLLVILPLEGWGTILFVMCNNGIYWRSRSCSRISGQQMGRLRVVLFAAVSVGLWVGAFTASAWNWKIFMSEGLPLAILVGMSYGVAWERWV